MVWSILLNIIFLFLVIRYLSRRNALLLEQDKLKRDSAAAQKQAQKAEEDFARQVNPVIKDYVRKKNECLQKLKATEAECIKRIRTAEEKSDKTIQMCRKREEFLGHLTKAQITFRDILSEIEARNQRKNLAPETVAQDAALIDKYFIQIIDKIKQLQKREEDLKEKKQGYRDICNEAKSRMKKADAEVVRIHKRLAELKEFDEFREARMQAFRETVQKKENALKEQKEKLQDLQDDIQARENALEQKKNSYAPLAAALSQYETLRVSALEDYYNNKPNPAYAKAFKISELKTEMKAWMRKYHEAKFLLDSYEALFPWLVEYKEFELDETASPVDFGGEDPVSHWIPAHEYDRLPPAERNQKALERYLKSGKNNREIGKLYERFIGYEYEQKGYKVSYFGALKGFEDLGRDIIAVKGNQHLIIQCKYWSHEKTIRENAICQLYGSTIRYRLEFSEQDLFGDVYDVHAILVTSTACSEMARDFAKFLHVELFEEKKYSDYPMVKCNIGKNGEKIYHLPFDQMYDRVVIEPEKGECYVQTCFEAEEKGFRRAFRWKNTENA